MSKRHLLTDAAGKTQTITEWAKETGIFRLTIYKRLEAGWSMQDALTRPPMRPRLITANGKTLPLATWAKRLGADPSVIRQRIKYGWPAADAVNLPVKQGCYEKRRVEGPMPFDHVEVVIAGHDDDGDPPRHHQRTKRG